MLRSSSPHRATARWRRSLLTTAVAAGVALSGSVATASAATAAPLPAGETASQDMTLLANLPKTGAFADYGAFNSDLAFQGDYAFAGNYNGFTVYDISTPSAPEQVAQVLCPGSQNDISVIEDLLVLSVDSRRTDNTCDSVPADADESRSGDYWEGIRVFDISDPTAPEYVAAVETDCGSHTHTLVPPTGKSRNLFVYVSSYGPSTDIARCQPPHDKISVVKVPMDAPASAKVVAEPVLFRDGGLTPRTAGCHDVTVYKAKNLAAGACMGEGVILDISNAERPKVVERVADTENFAFWHSATFSNEADKVIFTDELGGGGAPTCNPEIGPDKGANAVYTLAGKELSFASYYKIPREQADTENCVAHNGSLIPVPGKDIMVQAWYQGGISVVDYTDPAQPTELAWFDRGTLPLRENGRSMLGGSWSAYYYQGHVYSNDIQLGLDVLRIDDPAVASAASADFPESFNPQAQTTY